MTSRFLPVRRSVLISVALVGCALALITLRGASASASSTQVRSISAKPNMVLRFNTSHLNAHRGKIMIVMHNPSNAGMSHGIGINGHGVDRDGPIVSPGHTSTVTVTLTKKGNYTYYCPVPGHKQAGMKGTLTIS
jgi:plastocyanin